MRNIQTTASVATGSWVSVSPYAPEKASFQATVTGTGAVSGTVNIYATLRPDIVGAQILVGTMTISGTNVATAGFQVDASWDYYMADTTAISASSTMYVDISR